MSKRAVIQNEAISASAGTGKTFNLAVRYIRLLAAGVEPEKIVAMTFSRKAAGEIFDRIIQRLLAWIERPDKLREEGVPLGVPEISTQRLMELLRNILSSLHRLQIGTLDSFFVRIVKTFPFEFGLTGDFEIIDDQMFGQTQQKVLSNILREESKDTEKRDFIQEFKQATFGEEGKTLNRELEEFITYEHVKFMETMQVGEWGDLKKIWPEGNDLLNLYVNPIEEVAVIRSIIERYSDEKKRIRFLKFLSEGESFTSKSRFSEKSTINFYYGNLLDAMSDLERGLCNIRNYNTKTNPLILDENGCQHLLLLIRYILKCHIENALERSVGIYRILKRYENAYDRLIRRKGMLTFSDVQHTVSPVRASERGMILTGGSTTEENRLYIEYRLDNRYDHWLLDEFQDTNYDQWMIIKNLVDEVMQDTSGTKSFFYVGDIKQAIYGWRGGDARLFNTVHRNLNNRYGEFEMKHLSTSYRSSPQVIETVNRVFRGLTEEQKTVIPREFVEQWEWQEHKTAMEDIKGYAELVEIIREKGRWVKEPFLDRSVAIISKTIQEIRPFERGLSVAVLVRKNDTARELSERLKRCGIETIIEGSFAITDCDVVKAILSLVKFAAHPGDTLALEHVRMSPLGTFLGDLSVTVQELLDDISNHGFTYLVNKWIGRLENEASIAFNPFVRLRIGQMMTASRLFDATGGKNCLDYIDFFNSYESPSGIRSNAVQIMTVHKAKGLEWDVVFIPEMKDRTGITKARLEGTQICRDADRSPKWALRMPKRDVATKDEVLEDLVGDLDRMNFYEELCVLYVAMTRAKRSLYMIIESKGASEKSIQRADILRDTLRTDSSIRPYGDIQEINAQYLYQDGEKNWYEKHPKTREKGEPSKRVKKLTVSFDSRLRQTAPSRAEKRTVNLSTVFAGISTSAMNLGKAVHELYEHIEDLKTLEPEAISDTWLETTEYDDNLKKEACKIFLESFKSSKVREALTMPDNAEVWCEKEFEIIIGNEWVTGFFDRVTLVKDNSGDISNAIILDYKTDNVETDEDITRAVQTYQPQLDMYEKVLAKLVGISEEKIQKQLLFVRIGEVVLV